MAALAKTTLPAKTVVTGKADRMDQEFLPAAIEILQTPPSPIGTSLLLYICAAFLAALAWSYFGWLDIYAIAALRLAASALAAAKARACASRSAPVSVGSSSIRTSPAATRSPFATWMATILPG